MQTRHHINPEEWKCPKTFEEYLAQFPDWHKKWLNKRYPQYTNDDFEDVASAILLRSIETRRVERYAPTPDLKNRPGLFLHYMGMCFKRDLATILTARAAEKRGANCNTVSIDVVNNPDMLMVNGVEALEIPSSAVYKYRTEQEGSRAYTAARLSQFLAFVAKHRPDLLPVLDAMRNGDSIVSRQMWDYHKHKLRSLGKHFEAGTIPYNSAWKKEENRKRLEAERKERKYRKRKSKAQQKYYHSHLEEQREWHRQHSAKKKGKSGIKRRGRNFVDFLTRGPLGSAP